MLTNHEKSLTEFAYNQQLSHEPLCISVMKFEPGGTVDPLNSCINNVHLTNAASIRQSSAI